MAAAAAHDGLGRYCAGLTVWARHECAPGRAILLGGWFGLALLTKGTASYVVMSFRSL